VAAGGGDISGADKGVVVSAIARRQIALHPDNTRRQADTVEAPGLSA